MRKGEINAELWNKAIELANEYALLSKPLGRLEIERRLNINQNLAQKIAFAINNRETIGGHSVSAGVRPQKRVLLMGDTHCGHLAGLTPPPYQLNKDHSRLGEFGEFQTETWNWFYNQIEELKPFDVCIANGDLIDGRGERSKSTELLSADRDVQVDMAVDIIRKIGAKKVVMTYGTPYHTGQGEDFENHIAERVGAIALKPELNIEIEGVNFNVKHHTGNSSVPHGAGTAILKDALWTDLWAEFENRDKADIIVRSHIHTYLKITDRSRVAVTLPALQGAMTKYGQRRMVKIVDYGIAYVDIFEGGRFVLHSRLYKPVIQRNDIIKL